MGRRKHGEPAYAFERRRGRIGQGAEPLWPPDLARRADHGASKVIDSYRESWNSNRDALVGDASRPDTIDAFRASYPFHPDVLAALTGKTATLVTFQRVRGMLRLLAGTVAYLWNTTGPESGFHRGVDNKP